MTYMTADHAAGATADALMRKTARFAHFLTRA